MNDNTSSDSLNSRPYYEIVGENSGFVWFVTCRGREALPWVLNGIDYTGEPCIIRLRTEDNFEAQYQALREKLAREREDNDRREQRKRGGCPFEYVAPLDKGDAARR